MLEKYAKEQGFSNPEHYTDDGWSGTNFERPDWKRLLTDIEDGKVGCVIVKDMSRIGRNYLQVGFYTEVLFREKTSVLSPYPTALTVHSRVPMDLHHF